MLNIRKRIIDIRTKLGSEVAKKKSTAHSVRVIAVNELESLVKDIENLPQRHIYILSTVAFMIGACFGFLVGHHS